MAYLLLPIMGTGTIDDPFRPNFPLTVSLIPGFRWSAHIPSNPDGTPRFVDCYVWITDSIILPGEVTVTARPIARSAVLTRDPGASPGAMEQN